MQSEPTFQSPPSQWRPSPLRRLGRTRTWWWGLAAVTAVSAASIVHRTMAAAEAERDAWGTTEAVLVATGAIAPGLPLDEHTEIRHLPAAAVPEGALTEVRPGAIVGRKLRSGTVLTDLDVATATTPAAGEVSVAVPADDAMPPTRVGQEILLVVEADVFAGVEATVVPGRVGGRDADRLVVIVDARAVTAVAPAARAGRVAVALAG